MVAEINFILIFINFNDTLVSSTHTLPVNIFNLEGGEIMLARENENSPVLSDFLPQARIELMTLRILHVYRTFQPLNRDGREFDSCPRKFPLFRASMVSPPSKLKMFTGNSYVVLTRVSLKLIKIKIKLIYATTSS